LQFEGAYRKLNGEGGLGSCYRLYKYKNGVACSFSLF